MSPKKQGARVGFQWMLAASCWFEGSRFWPEVSRTFFEDFLSCWHGKFLQVVTLVIQNPPVIPGEDWHLEPLKALPQEVLMGSKTYSQSIWMTRVIRFLPISCHFLSQFQVATLQKQSSIFQPPGRDIPQVGDEISMAGNFFPVDFSWYLHSGSQT